MTGTKARPRTRWPKVSDAPGTYGLTAVTLGEVLKNELDEVVAATKENRSEIIRKALEQYFEGLPGLEERRRKDREKARDLQFVFLFSRILGEFESVMREFAYQDALPVPADLYGAIESALDKARERLASQLPDGLDYKLPREMSLALSDIHRGFHRLFVEADKKEWQREGVARWRRKLELDKGAAQGESE